MGKRDNRAFLTGANRLLAAEATKAIVAAPAAGFKLKIFRVIATVGIAAAQIVQVGASGGGVTQQLFVIRASGVEPVLWESDEGFELPAATALSAVPAGAGPEVHFFVEYMVIPASVA